MVEICQTPLLPPSAKCRRSPWDQTLTLIVPSHNEYWLCVLRRGILWWQNCITRFCTCVGWMDITFDNYITYKIRTITYEICTRYVLRCDARFCICGVDGLHLTTILRIRKIRITVCCKILHMWGERSRENDSPHNSWSPLDCHHLHNSTGTSYKWAFVVMMMMMKLWL